MPEPEPVSVRDLEVADRIARAVRGGRPADRTPTVEQIVAAFGEAEPTVDARRRAARALALAGVAAVPDIMEAAPGQRLTLEVRHERRRRALVVGVVALVLLFAAAAVAATQLDLDDGGDTASDLPASTTTEPTTATNTVTQEPTTSSGSTSTAAKPPATAAERRRAKRARERRARQARAARAKRARARRAEARRAAARRRVTVRLDARLATFLCVEGDGKQLFNGTLSGARTFRGRVVRLNIGLGPSTRLTANGKAVPLTASPTGLELTPKSRKFLPLGSRPCA
jgi:uncharacterized protein (DUF4415 family)